MSAGLPGFGLSGVFFVFSALLMVPIELVATLRGRSSLERWGRVLRSAGIALAILGGTELTYAAVHLALTQLSGPATSARSGSAQPGARTTDVVRAIPVLPIVGTVGLVVIVIVAAKAAELLTDLRRRPDPAANSSRSPRTDPPDPRSRPRHPHPHRARDEGAPRSARTHQGSPAVRIAD
jgi:hypothetical protein